MSEDFASPINSDSGQGLITEQPLPPSPKEREPARLPRDAALKRRQERLKNKSANAPGRIATAQPFSVSRWTD
jgi:hypothetical protein